MHGNKYKRAYYMENMLKREKRNKKDEQDL